MADFFYILKTKIKDLFLQKPVCSFVVSSVLFFSFLIWIIFGLLDLFTLHGDYVLVPNLNRKSLSEVNIKLTEMGLRYEILDSALYNASLPKHTVVDQTPDAGSKVKDGRKIYLTINPSQYRKVKMPDLIQLTRRNAEPLLLSAGLRMGQIIYVRNIGKDVVLAAYYKGKKIDPGSMVSETSEIDLECGDGNY